MPQKFTTLIDAHALKALLADGVAVLFDCSFDLADPAAGHAAYRAGHIPGASYLHLDTDLSSPPSGSNGRHPLPSPDGLAAMLRARGLRQGQQAVAYDRSGGPYAARLWWLLRWMGHDAVAVLDGGWDAWLAAGGENETGDAATPPAGDFAPRLRGGTTVEAGDLIGALGTDRYRVIDARSPERFRGDPNPLDPVAGHIPGAGNRFFQHNLDGGKWKSPARLREEFAVVIDAAGAREVVMQCGSGVTACHNALAMAHAGLPDPLLYPGSWSEWIADSSRPVAQGE